VGWKKKGERGREEEEAGGSGWGMDAVVREEYKGRKKKGSTGTTSFFFRLFCSSWGRTLLVSMEKMNVRPLYGLAGRSCCLLEQLQEGTAEDYRPSEHKQRREGKGRRKHGGS